MRKLIIALALLAIGSPARGSDNGSSGLGSLALSPFVGAYIPTGDQHKELSTSVLTGAQLGYDLSIPIRVVGSVGWTPSHDRNLSDTRSSIFQYDAGFEVSRRSMGDEPWRMSPFVGLGLGARTYQLKRFTSSDQTDFAGYGSVGGELSRSRVGARVELRDYLSRFKGIEGQSLSPTRNDLTLMGAVTFHL